ncbi:MAG: ATP-binding protein [Gemmatimonadota bacterium]
MSDVEPELTALRLGFTAATEALVVVELGTDGTARIVLANPAAQALAGAESAPLAGQDPAMFAGLVASDVGLEQLGAAARQAQPFEGELAIRTGGTEITPLEVRITPILDRGRVTHFVATGRSIANRRHVEQQLWRVQRLDAVAQLAGGLSHELKHIVQTLDGFGNLLLSKTRPTDPRRADVEALGAAGRRGATLVQQLLTFAGRRVAKPIPLDLNQTIQGIRELLEAMIGEEIRFLVDLSPDVKTVVADPGELQQILVNLISNARTAMPDGGTLTLTSENVGPERPLDFQSMFGTGRYVLVSVSDTGVGMSPETKAQLFQPFFTTKTGGSASGLGLAAVHQIVRQAGGHVWLRSAAGAGTTIEVFLPASEAEPIRPTPTRLEAPALRGNGETVLVVEDDPLVLGFSERVLENYGYNVLAAPGAAVATTIASEQGRSIDLLVTDIVMPGQRGPDLARELQEDWPGLRVLYVSGYSAQDLPADALSASANLLEKPFTGSELAAAVRRSLDQGGPE